MGQKILPFRGAATALVTPFTCTGAIDFPSLGQMIEFQIKSQIDALVILGTTGESSTLTHDERLACIEFAVKTARGRVPIIAGVGTNDTGYSANLSREACRLGADALLAVTPYYNKTSPDGLIAHFSAIADAASVPIILYTVPSRTGMSIPLSVYRKLAEIENIAAVKEASGSISAVTDICAELGDSLAVYSGNDDMIVPVLSVGGAGVISVLSNIMPKEVSELCRSFENGDISAAKNEQLRLNSLIHALFSDVNPIPVKCACSMMGLCRETMRLPLVPLSEEKRLILEKEMINTGLI